MYHALDHDYILLSVYVLSVMSSAIFQYDSMSGLALPSKKTFNNMNKDFLERRKVGLNAYLQVRLV